MPQPGGARLGSVTVGATTLAGAAGVGAAALRVAGLDEEGLLHHSAALHHDEGRLGLDDGAARVVQAETGGGFGGSTIALVPVTTRPSLRTTVLG